MILIPEKYLLRLLKMAANLTVIQAWTEMISNLVDEKCKQWEIYRRKKIINGQKMHLPLGLSKGQSIEWKYCSTFAT